MTRPTWGRRHDERPLIRAVQERHPPFTVAVRADLDQARAQRGEREPLRSRAEVVMAVLRQAWTSDAFGALVLYRLKAACQRRGIPVVPRVAHRLAIAWAQLSIGDPVLVHPGIIVPHGQVVIDGFVEIHPGARLRPWITIGLKEGIITGPTLHRNVSVGTGAKILGPITVGAGARIGANAVVLGDVPAGAVYAGVPARALRGDVTDES